MKLLLKNISHDLHASLKESAGRNRRSLNDEILARLESGFAAEIVDRETHDRTMRAFVASQPRVDHAKVSRYKRQCRA